MTLQGVAQSNERVSELLRNLGNNSPWLTKPELVEIVAGTVALSPRDQRRVANFTMRVGLLRASEAQKPRAPPRRPLPAAPPPRRRRPDHAMATNTLRQASISRACSSSCWRSSAASIPNDPSSWPAVAALLLLCAGRSWSRRGRRCGSSGSATPTTNSKPSAPRKSTLREDYKKKLAQAVNLDALKKQREQVQQYVTQLEKQLPSKAEMDALLSDINQAGLGRSLQFELFRPGQVSVKDYYAELPIALRVTGRYHDIGAFASDIANLSRIVTLNNLSIAPGKRRHSGAWTPPPRPSATSIRTKSAAQRKARAAAGAKK